MKRKKPVISIFASIWGHKSLGLAAYEALSKSDYKIISNLIKPDTFSTQSSNIPYLLFPSFTIIPYQMAKSEHIRKIAEKYLLKTYFKKIEKLISIQQPDIVISTYFAFNFALENLSKIYKFLLINIIANPRTIHKIEVSNNAYNFILDKKAEKTIRHFGIDKEHYKISGWFVRKEFQKNYDRTKIRKLLGLNPNYFTLCVIGGSEGTLTILKILPAFLELNQKVQVVFICGKNKSLYKSLRLFQEIHKLSNGSNTTFIIRGYTENTHEYLQASDLVIGKAGPNLLFESVATHTPFLAISHIWGQEDGNLEIIKKYKLGFVEENPVKAINLTRKIIRNPKMLNWFQKPLEKLAEYNNNSYQILRDFVAEILLVDGKQ